MKFWENKNAFWYQYQIICVVLLLFALYDYISTSDLTGMEPFVYERIQDAFLLPPTEMQLDIWLLCKNGLVLLSTPLFVFVFSLLWFHSILEDWNQNATWLYGEIMD